MYFDVLLFIKFYKSICLIQKNIRKVKQFKNNRLKGYEELILNTIDNRITQELKIKAKGKKSLQNENLMEF